MKKLICASLITLLTSVKCFGFDLNQRWTNVNCSVIKYVVPINSWVLSFTNLPFVGGSNKVIIQVLSSTNLINWKTNYQVNWPTKQFDTPITKLNYYSDTNKIPVSPMFFRARYLLIKGN